VEVRNGRLVRITEDKEHPAAELLSRVIRACPRARMATEWFYHPERLNYPLKRIGERGEGKWQRISWEQALDEIAAKLRNIKESYGAEAIATSKGTGRTDDYYRARFFNLLGSPNNIGQGMICWSVNNMVSSAIVGWPSNNIVYRPDITRCLLLIGTNPAQSVLRSWLSILDAKKQGAKIIVIDPRRTETAARADIWLQLRPGTDTALLMGMINVIITEGLYDREFVDKWCYGFEKLAERAQEYSPEKVAEITLVLADKASSLSQSDGAGTPLKQC
jgi:anaerobic selenocysteine-containing dehydrogenase